MSSDFKLYVSTNTPLNDQLNILEQVNYAISTTSEYPWQAGMKSHTQNAHAADHSVTFEYFQGNDQWASTQITTNKKLKRQIN